MQLAALSHNFLGLTNVFQFTHFHQFCFNFFGKDEVFRGLLFVNKQVKPGFTNYQPRSLADQIKFEV